MLTFDFSKVTSYVFLAGIVDAKSADVLVLTINRNRFRSWHLMKPILKSKSDSWNDTTTASDEIAYLQHGNYDAILMDYQMPNMDGPTAIRAIRSLGYKGVVIGVTGNVMALDQQEMMAAGANDVLPKPFDIDKFWDAYNRTATNTQSFR